MMSVRRSCSRTGRSGETVNHPVGPGGGTVLGLAMLVPHFNCLLYFAASATAHFLYVLHDSLSTNQSQLGKIRYISSGKL